MDPNVVQGMAPAGPATPIQPSPLPLSWMIGQVVNPADGKVMVVIQVASPAGVMAFFLAPDEAVDIGQKFRQAGKAGQVILASTLPNGTTRAGT